MKKVLLGIIATLLLANPAFAQSGPKSNVWASWVTVTNSQTTMSLPFESRDIIISNGDNSTPICVSLTGDTIVYDSGTLSCRGSGNTVFKVDLNEQMNFSDFRTDTISMIIHSNSGSTTASHVSVVVTF